MESTTLAIGTIEVRREEWWTVTMRVQHGDQVLLDEITVEADELLAAVAIAEAATPNLVESIGVRHRGVLVRRPG